MSSPSSPSPPSEAPAYLQALRALAPHWLELGVSSLLINGCGLLMPVFSMLVYDKVVGNGNNETLWALTLGMLLLAGVEFVLRAMRGYALEQMAVVADVGVEQTLLARLLDSRAQAATPVGALMSRHRDHAGARDHLFSQYVVAASDLPFLVLFLLVLFLIGGAIVGVPLVIGALMLGGHALLHRPARDYGVRNNACAAEKIALLGEIVEGVDLVRSSVLKAAVSRRWVDLVERGALTRGRARFWQALGQAWGLSCITLASVLVLVVGVYRIEAGLLSIGSLIACSLINLRAMALMASAVGLAVSVRDLRRTQSDLDSATAGDAPRTDGQRSGPGLSSVRGEVVVHALDWRFDGHTDAALSGVTLHIRPGERVALVGRPGSGKSTLLRCLAGLLDVPAGQVLVDGTAITAFSDEQRAGWMAWKPQAPVLLSGSLQDNLLSGEPEEDDARGRAVMESVGLGRALRNGELRLDLKLQTAGANLSGGQRQVVGLARALWCDRAIYLLDEPTAGVDDQTERELALAVQRHTAGRTLIIATHSKHMLEVVDRIVVMERGRVVADGARDKILA